MVKPDSDDDAREPPANRESDSALLDAREAARLCRVSLPMLYKLNASGRMPCPIKIGSLMRWKRKEILTWIDAGCPAGQPGKTEK